MYSTKFGLLRQLLFVYQIFLLAYANDENDLIVETKLGKLKGFIIELENSEKADIFLNIPFAKPPVGELRFEKPQPPEPWSGIRESTNFGPSCMPHVRRGGFGVLDYSEDCLTLNVFRPHKKSDQEEGYPVLVWVHGGGFVVGSASHTGFVNVTNNFIPHDIIVVSIQYRLGPFGWLSTGDSVFPGNIGFWDQTAALKFIHENIAYFGGNPNKLTVWGVSAGGVSVSALTLSPHSRDYVSGSVEMSGSTFAAWASNDVVIDATKELAKALNCGNEDSKKVKDCLKSKTVDEILEAVKETGPSRKGINFSKYEPRVDGDFFPEDYLELIKNAPKKPAMIGFTEVESAIFTLIMGDKTITSVYIPSEKYQEFGEDSLKQFIKEYVASEAIFGEKAQEVQDKVFEFYGVRNQPKNVDYKFYIDRYTQILSDTQFIIPGLLTAQEKLKNDWPVYLYQNEHYNKKNFPDDFPVKGALHGSEYTYLHGTTFGPTEFDEDDRKFQKLLTESVANFVKTGNPSIKQLDWPKLNKNHPLRYASLKVDATIHEPLLKDRVDFWDGLTKNYSYNIIRGLFTNELKKEKEEL